MAFKKQTRPQKPIVGLYGDTGVAPHSFFQLKKLLYPDYAVVKLKAFDLIQHNWPANMQVLIMPGGADVSYHQKLQGSGCANIRAFVEAGGLYVGICAGSYFAGESIYFTCANGDIISDSRELRFCKGRVVGPVFGPYLETGHTSAKLVPVIIAGNTYQAYWNGGGFFEGVKEADIIGRYQASNQPMAVLCKVGLGAALLCAVHPEYDQAFLVSKVAAKVQGYESLEPMLRIGLHETVKHWFLQNLSQSLQRELRNETIAKK